MPRTDDKSSRRALLRTCARYTVLAGLAFTGGALAARARETCINDNVCRGCGRFDYCALPGAWSTRQMNARKEKLAPRGKDTRTNG